MMRFKKRRWDILNEFARQQRAITLKKLTSQAGLRILESLCLFAQGSTDKKYFQKIDLRKIKALSKVHNLFMNVK